MIRWLCDGGGGRSVCLRPEKNVTKAQRIYLAHHLSRWISFQDILSNIKHEVVLFLIKEHISISGKKIQG